VLLRFAAASDARTRSCLSTPLARSAPERISEQIAFGWTRQLGSRTAAVRGSPAVTAYSPVMTGNRRETLRRRRRGRSIKSVAAQGKTSIDWHCCEQRSCNGPALRAVAIERGEVDLAPGYEVDSVSVLPVGSPARPGQRRPAHRRRCDSCKADQMSLMLRSLMPARSASAAAVRPGLHLMHVPTGPRCGPSQWRTGS